MNRLTIRQAVLALSLALAFSILAFAQSRDAWPEISSAEMQMSGPVVDPSADAEALNWDVRIEDEYFRSTGYKTTLHHFLRVKLFTERGREKFSKFEIPFGKIEDLGIKVQVKDIAARTIAPDGKIHEVKDSEIFDQDSVKADGVRIRVKSFAMPGVSQGAIVEFRWKEIRSNSLSNYVRIQYARDIPVQRVKYSVKPVSFPRGALAMRIHSANVTSNFVKEKGDFYSITMTSIAAMRSEPRMRAPFEIQPWSLIYYADPDLDTQGSDKYWAATAKKNYEQHTAMLKFDGSVRHMAQEITAGAASHEDKVRRIFEFCRRNIKNVEDDAGAVDSKENFKPNANSADVLKRSVGTWHDIGMLFGSMVNAVGLDARVANVARKIDPSFDKNITNDYFIRTEIMAVKLGRAWTFFDFSNRHLPFGMLPASVEGQPALISSTEATEWVVTPHSPASASATRRTADLKLSSDGTIEGSVRYSFTGQFAGIYKEQIDDKSNEAREKWLTEMIKREISTRAEVTGVSLQGLENSEEPLSISFTIRIPSYADVTGKRLFLRPNIFERNATPDFVSSFRFYDISFDHRWSESDELTIRLPDGYAIESAEEPAAILDQIVSISNKTMISTSPDSQVLSFSRSMAFDGSNGLVFDVSSYPQIRRVFEAISKSNEHAIALRQK